MNKKKIIVAVIAVVLLAVLTTGVVFAVDYVSVTGNVDDKRINNGISIGEVDVSGMTKEEAVEAVGSYVNEIGQSKLVLKEEESGGSVEVNVNDLGLSCSNAEDAAEQAMDYGKDSGFMDKYKALKKLKKDGVTIDMHMSVNRDDIEEIVSKNSEQFEAPGEDATLEKTENGFKVNPETTGVVVDIEESIDKINEYMSESWSKEEAGEIALVVTVDTPKVTSEDLESIKDVIGEANTNFSSSNENRVKNVQTGASHINGSVILPGEEFSVYEAVNPFTYDNGYAMAGSYENGQVVESMGGGICQVSTTLYNAVLRSELEVTERFPHSMTVAYVDPAKDAAIAGTYKDLKFKNNMEKPVYIEGYTQGRDVYFKIWGEDSRSANRKVEYVSETVSTTQPSVKYEATGGAFGSKSTSSGRIGKVAKLWKVVYENGEQVSRDLVNTSSYSKTDTVVSIGTSGADAESVKALKAAIKSGDEGKINVAIAAGKNKDKDKDDDKDDDDKDKKDDNKDKKDDSKDKKDNSKKDDKKKDDNKKDDNKKDDNKKDDNKKDDNKTDDAKKDDLE